MIVNDLDLGGSHAFPSPQVGQIIGSALIEGSRTIVWPRGQSAEKQEVRFWINPFQALGGGAAGSFTAARYLVRQLEELATNPDLQPVYIRWTSTAQSGGYNVIDTHDGWYVIQDVQPDYMKFIVSGLVSTKMTVQQVAPAVPSSLQVWYSGVALSSNYSAGATPLIGYPVGSTQQPPTQATRTGGEGGIPISTLPLSGSGAVDPAPFAAPAVSNFWLGGVRAWDNLVAGSGPPTNGAYVGVNWVEIKGTTHVLSGDLVVTNGLLLLRFQTGTSNSPEVWLWDTNLSAWSQLGAVQYQSNAGTAGTLREISLDRLGLEEARVRITCGTAAGQYCRLDYKLPRGCYHCYVDVWPRLQNHNQKTNLIWSTASVYATGFNETNSATTFPSDLAPTTTSGYSGVQGSATNSPVFGFLYLNQPTTDQGFMSSNNVFGLGDTAGPQAGSFTRYGIWGAPYTGAPAVATARGIAAPIFQQFLYDKTVRWTRG